jgi:hypothetical protein
MKIIVAMKRVTGFSEFGYIGASPESGTPGRQVRANSFRPRRIAAFVARLDTWWA